MTARAVAVVVAALLLSGCASAVSGSGSVSGSATVRPPCSSDTLAPSSSASAPGCAPSPSPTGSTSPTSSPTSSATVPSRWSAYTRNVFATRLGDPGVLNVCAVAGSADLPGSLTFAKPSSTLAASCSLDITGRGAGRNDPALVVSVLRDSTTRDPAGTKRTRVQGQLVLAQPYDAKHGTCGRTLRLEQPGVTTSVSTTLYGGIPGGAAAVCGVNDAVITRFATIASGAAQVLVLPIASPSLLSLDACKVASAAKFRSLPLLTGSLPARPSDFDTSCAFGKPTGATLYVSTGVLRSANDTPDGKPVTVAGHRLYDTATLDSVCSYTSKQAQGETVEIYYSGRGTPSTATCGQVATALGKYLDVLGLT